MNVKSELIYANRLNRIIVLWSRSNTLPPLGDISMSLLRSRLALDGQDKPPLQWDLDNIIILI